MLLVVPWHTLAHIVYFAVNLYQPQNLKNMNAAEWHLIMNHVPVTGIIFGTLLLLAGLIARSRDVKLAGLVFFIVAAIMAYPVVASGEGAEEIVEELGVSHDVIHDHEELAESALWLVLGLGVLAILALLLTYRKHNRATTIEILTLLAALPICFVMANVAHTGGEIRHPEMREDFVIPGEVPEGLQEDTAPEFDDD